MPLKAQITDSRLDLESIELYKLVIVILNESDIRV